LLHIRVTNFAKIASGLAKARLLAGAASQQIERGATPSSTESALF
jgi:hypothetical protein